MPRIRTLKPDIWEDEAIGTLDPLSVLSYIGLITQADDEGRLWYRPRILRLAIFPYNDDLTDEDMISFIDCLHDALLVHVYETGNRKAIWLVSWKKHQVINRPTPSVIPPPTEDSLRAHGIDSDGSVLEGKGREGKRKGKGKAPSDDVQALIDDARIIKGWTFTPEQDAEFFPRLLERYSSHLIHQVIEDLRTEQEKPTKVRKNLHSTLSNWCRKHKEWHGDPHKDEAAKKAEHERREQARLEREHQDQERKQLEALTPEGLQGQAQFIVGLERNGNGGAAAKLARSALREACTETGVDFDELMRSAGAA